MSNKGFGFLVLVVLMATIGTFVFMDKTFDMLSYEPYSYLSFLRNPFNYFACWEMGAEMPYIYGAENPVQCADLKNYEYIGNLEVDLI